MIFQPTHMIDHHRHRHALEYRGHFGQVARIDPQLQVPAEIGELRQQRLDFL